VQSKRVGLMPKEKRAGEKKSQQNVSSFFSLFCFFQIIFFQYTKQKNKKI